MALYRVSPRGGQFGFIRENSKEFYGSEPRQAAILWAIWHDENINLISRLFVEHLNNVDLLDEEEEKYAKAVPETLYGQSILSGRTVMVNVTNQKNGALHMFDVSSKDGVFYVAEDA